MPFDWRMVFDPGIETAIVVIAALGIALAVHLVAVVGMCLSRTRRAYIELKS